MDQVEAKLKEYRKKKQREETFAKLKDKFWRFMMFGTGIGEENRPEDASPPPRKPEDDKISISSAECDSDTPSEFEGEGRPLNGKLEKENNYFKYILRVIYLLIWVTLFAIAIELKFGTVFLMFSALIGIYLNTRTGPKKRNEISAYSVFNKNCESIDGSLKAEQFEREIRFGPGSVK